MRANWLGGFAAIILLCTTVGANAEAAKPGSTEPPAATETPVTDAKGHPTSTEAKTAKKKQVRHHRRWRHRHYGYYHRPFFDFLRPWPRYRYHRWHYRHHRWGHHRHYRRRHWWWW